MAEEEVQSKTVAMRIQGKIASKMSSKGLAKQVVDGPTSDLIDNCYRIAKTYLGNKKDAEKIMKNMIKIVVKVALLSRNNLFTQEDLQHAQKFQDKFKSIAKALISFYDIDFTYDGEWLMSALKESEELLTALTKNHLTEKSMKRIEHVYGFFTNRDLLDKAFASNSEYRTFLGHISKALNTLIEQGEL